MEWYYYPLLLLGLGAIFGLWFSLGWSVRPRWFARRPVMQTVPPPVTPAGVVPPAPRVAETWAITLQRWHNLFWVLLFIAIAGTAASWYWNIKPWEVQAGGIPLYLMAVIFLALVIGVSNHQQLW